MPIVLIDDDSLVRLTWKVAAKNSSVDFQSFSSLEEFLNQKDQFSSSVTIYIDSNLGNGVRGEVVAEQLHKLGFTQIYLATGYEPGQFGHIPWIKGIVGKDPPFGLR